MVLPFFFSLLMITFLLFINFLLRAVDRFLGKGLDVITILEYLFLNLAWIIALAVPMAVLLSTLMTFGRLSEDNEINAMRASGVGFLSIIRAPLMFGITIALLLIFFNNFILPDMNFRARLLSGDIYRKRPGMNIEPGIFLDNLPDYSMIVGGKDGEIMSDVRIFSKGKQEAQTSIHAKTGTLSTLADAFLLTLFDGEIHELEFNYTPAISSWIALRIFPSSHTNPIFVEVDHKPIHPSRRSAEWCLQAVDVCWERKRGQIRDHERDAAAAAYEVARQAYRRIRDASFDDRSK